MHDLFLVSYPKSGNTWLRFIVANLMFPDISVTFSNIEQLAPDIYQHSSNELNGVRDPRALKSHEYFDPRYKKVIYIVRDPRAVVVSYYYHGIKFRAIEPDCPMSSFVDDFIHGNLDSYGTWGENVGSWMGARGEDSNFLWLRYEDLTASPESSVSKIAAFLSIAPSDELVQRAVSCSSFDRMQELEKQQGAQWLPLKHSRIEPLFLRKGPRGTWRDELGEADAQKIEHTWRPLMKDLQYI